MTARPSRRTWTTLDDDRLLAQCEVDTYRASGPGGQKRNKTSSAVRLRHLPSGLLVIAEESRSQHENKAKALVRLRRELHLKWRDPGSVDSPEIAEARDKEGKLKLSPRDPRFWPAASAVLDLLVDHQGRVAETAEKLQLSTAQLVDFLVDEEHLRRETNRLRAELGLKPLKVN